MFIRSVQGSFGNDTGGIRPPAHSYRWTNPAGERPLQVPQSRGKRFGENRKFPNKTDRRWAREFPSASRNRDVVSRTCALRHAVTGTLPALTTDQILCRIWRKSPRSDLKNGTDCRYNVFVLNNGQVFIRICEPEAGRRQ